MKLLRQLSQQKKTGKVAICSLAFAIAGSVTANAQNGYLYIHQKSLNEDPGQSFSYSVSGGATVVPNFSLNDQSAQLRVLDIGAAQNGRMWATEQNTSKLYYRNPGSNVWTVATNTGVDISDAKKVDGDVNGTAVYINNAGTAFSTNGITATQISTTGAFAGTADIGSGWDGLPYVCVGHTVYRYSGTGTTWNVVINISSSLYDNAHSIDVDPVSKTACLSLLNASGNARVIKVTATGVLTDIGAPGAATANVARDVAVNSIGEIFVISFVNGAYVSKYSGSGTTWDAKELASFDAFAATGGVGGGLWVTMASGGYGTQAAFAAYPHYNIFTRAVAGSTVSYIDDERVRTTEGNSVIIPVAAGSYTVTQNAAAGWDLQGIQVYDPTSNSTSTGNAATIVVAAGETVHAVFQTGQLNAFTMTNSCSSDYLETFGTGATGTFGSLVQGQTSYHFLNTNIPGEDGYCKVVSTAYPDFNTWQATPFYDHTTGTGSGRMYAVNAGYDKGEFFRRRFIGLINGAHYDFSAWAANLTPSASNIKPNIKFQVVDHATQAVLATYNTGDISTAGTQWNQYVMSFVATSTDIDLILSNNSVGGSGNDLAIDDISFALSPPGTPVVTTTNLGCATSTGMVEITAPVGVAGTYQYSKDGVTWQTGTTFSGLTAGTYTISSRFAITSDCISTSAITVKAAICGTVIHDANGLTDNILNGTGLGNPGGTTLYANLLNDAGTMVIASVAVNPDGTYSLPADPNVSYKVQVTTVQGVAGSAAPATTLPAGWIQTGDITPGSPATALTPGISATIVLGTASVNGVNFGTEQIPVVTPKAFNVTSSVFSATPPASYPVVPGYVSIPSNSASLTGYNGTGGMLSGTDPEDCAAANSCNTGKTFTIGTINTNTRLYYDFGAGPVLVTSGTVLLNYDPSKLVIYGQAGSGMTGTPVGFTYTMTDAAGKVSTSGAYAITSTTALPVDLVSFSGTANGCRVTISWQTANENNTDHYEIENSTDGKNYDKIGTEAAHKAPGGNGYTFSFLQSRQIAYYRLKVVSLDNPVAYSQTILVTADCKTPAVHIYPNPTSDNIEVTGLTEATTRIFDIAGRLIATVKLGANDRKTINMASYPAGVYYLYIQDSTDRRVQRFKVIKL